MDEKKISILVLMDMSKAFDSIKHDTLLFLKYCLLVNSQLVQNFFKLCQKSHLILLIVMLTVMAEGCAFESSESAAYY